MIGFFDSGIGGISVLNACSGILQTQNVIYFSDNKNAPFGDKTAKKIEKIAIKAVKFLIKKGCKIIVIACNTATACAIGVLRKKFKNIIFVGTEPNIKTPIKLGFKHIVVLATPATVKHSRLLRAYENTIDVLSLPTLAKTIETGIGKIEDDFKNIDGTIYDAVVLGCTHYVFAKKQLKKLFPNAQFFDSSSGVKNRLKTLLKGVIKFEHSGNFNENLAKKLTR